MQSFCDIHILAFIKSWDFNTPLDLALSSYFKSHKSLGSHDRKTIGNIIYSWVRWWSLFENIPPNQVVKMLRNKPAENWAEESNLPEHCKLGLPPFLYNELKKAYADDFETIGKCFNENAPIAIRANRLKISREELQKKLPFPTTFSNLSKDGLVLQKREPLFTLKEFKEGLFEVQDEASQKIAEFVNAQKGERILDYCSGSGGKSLSIAPDMGGKGELYLHDIRRKALDQAKIRLRRAGVQNAQILPPDHPTLLKLKRKMDVVLLDVPCSGSGTLRRNPDMKWKIDFNLLERLKVEQREIFAKGVEFLKESPSSRIVYSTCSLLPDENEKQVEFFLKQFPLEVETQWKNLPKTNQADGFFAIVFKNT